MIAAGRDVYILVKDGGDPEELRRCLVKLSRRFLAGREKADIGDNYIPFRADRVIAFASFSSTFDPY
jgi:hypothetical protein